MSDVITIYDDSAKQAPLPHRDYTLALLTRCAETGEIDDARLAAIRDALHSAVVERAAAFTKGRSTTVTMKQAESFYKSVLCQLDACLLSARSDIQAITALREKPLTELLHQGQIITLEMYQNSKEYFRKAYMLTRPYETSLFHGLLRDFAWYCTKYDARFRADDIGLLPLYPTAFNMRITERGAFGLCLYYRMLMTEGEILNRFDRDEMLQMLDAYAAKYLTERGNIAENLCELAMRHWLTALTARGKAVLTVTLTADDLTRTKDVCMYCSPEQLTEKLSGLVLESAFSRSKTELNYLLKLLPLLSEQLHRRALIGTLTGWLAVNNSEFGIRNSE